MKFIDDDHRPDGARMIRFSLAIKAASWGIDRSQRVTLSDPLHYTDCRCRF